MHGAWRGGRPSPEYNVWLSMRARVCNRHRFWSPVKENTGAIRGFSALSRRRDRVWAE
jgi:hypothetical protein